MTAQPRPGAPTVRPIPRAARPKWIMRSCSAVLLTCLLSAVPVSGVELVLHTATAGNTLLHVTQLDHPALNDNPNAQFLVCHVFNPLGQISGILNPANTGLSYSLSSGKWSLENEDLSAMPIGAQFFLLIPPFGLTGLHIATAENTEGATTILDDPFTNGNGGGGVGFTFIRNPGGGSGARNAHPVASSYREDLERWTFVNQDGADIPVGAGFVYDGSFSSTKASVQSLTISVGTHVTTFENTSADLTRIDRSALNGQPYSFVFAFPMVNGAVNPHPIATAYDFFEQQWAILNADTANLPLGMQFGIFYVGAQFVDGFESGDLGGWSNDSSRQGMERDRSPQLGSSRRAAFSGTPHRLPVDLFAIARSVDSETHP